MKLSSTIRFLGESCPSYRRTSALFLRALGLIYFLHFASVLPQLRGVIGEHGIAPIGENLRYLRSVSAAAPLAYPSLFWISAANPFLIALALCALALSLAVSLGSSSLPVLLALWVFQLSLVNSSPFFGFVWDTCLAQAGFAALFLGRLRGGLRPARSPSRAAVLALRFLFFHVMFMMACCKAFSVDPGWKDFTFLRSFWQNQPMPSAAAWWLSQLPTPLVRAATFLSLVAESLLPLSLFLPSRLRRCRLVLFTLSISLQASILASGNYGYFNVLMMALSLFCLDDSFLPAWLLKGRETASPPPGRARKLVALAALAFVAANASLYYFDLNELFGELETAPSLAKTILYPLAAYRIAVPYNLFGSVPATHRVVTLEQSDDGIAWGDLPLVYGPGPESERPRDYAPWQWRIDHEMYYAALQLQKKKSGDRYAWFVKSYWFTGLVKQLLRGEPDVLGLFPGLAAKPHRLRAVIYDYRFTTPAQRSATGKWWMRTPVYRSEELSEQNAADLKIPFRPLAVVPGS